MPVPVPTHISAEALEHNKELQRRMRERGQRHADRTATLLCDAGFEAEERIDAGNPTEQLLKGADSGEFDLVAVGSRGLGPFRRALLGSVSDHVVRHSRRARRSAADHLTSSSNSHHLGWWNVRPAATLSASVLNGCLVVRWIPRAPGRLGQGSRPAGCRGPYESDIDQNADDEPRMEKQSFEQEPENRSADRDRHP